MPLQHILAVAMVHVPILHDQTQRWCVQVERSRLETEYQSRIQSLQTELGRMREELAYRTSMMQSEMTRWVVLPQSMLARVGAAFSLCCLLIPMLLMSVLTLEFCGSVCRWQKQAHMTAAAVVEAKNEVLERKRELDHTKLKMDGLIEKLYVGRESTVALQGQIASLSHHNNAAHAHFNLMSNGQHGGAQAQHRPQPPMFSALPAGRPSAMKLPPVKTSFESLPSYNGPPSNHKSNYNNHNPYGGYNPAAFDMPAGKPKLPKLENGRSKSAVGDLPPVENMFPHVQSK